MKKLLALLLLSPLVVSEEVELYCISYLDNKRLDDFNNWMQTPIKEDGLLSIVEYSLRESFRNNVEACIEELLPAEEYIISFDDSYLSKYGKFSVSQIKRNCILSSPDEYFDDDMESLQEMVVTKNKIKVGNNRLIVNRKDMSAIGTSIIGGETVGPYPFECSIL
ncbi:MAG: hypothetical protein O3A49_06860 [Candidatus Marinimicrobia bacterium]|jgi:hypothetical protein|nr:hypothetical protein [Candidatus Neomarinimicrobiota bacterium]